MIWTIYKIWLVVSLILCYLGHKTEKDIYGFIAIISTIAMFYVPFMVWLFQNKNLTFVTKYDIINIESKKGEKKYGNSKKDWKRNT